MATPDHRSDATRILIDLRERIIDGSLPGGTRVVERTVADAHGVSRVPVRQALRRLAFEGLVDVRARSGWRVHAMTVSDVADLNEVHRAFDALANRQAALRRTDEDLVLLRRSADACAAAVESGDVAALRTSGFAFRQSVFAAAGNGVLNEIQTMLQGRMRRLIITGADTSRMVSLYEGIYEAIAAQDPEAAEAAILAFLDSFRATQRERLLTSLRADTLPVVEQTVAAAGDDDPDEQAEEEFAPDFARVLPVLRRQILDGDRRAGDVVPERSVAEEFRVSRLPVRQAMEILVTEGLLTPGSTRRPATVRGLTLHEAEDLLEVCITLDSLSARLAAHRPQAQDVAALREFVRQEEQCAATGELDALRDLVFAFRRRLHAMSVNKVVQDIDRIVDSRLRLLIGGDEFEELACVAHRLIADAIERRDPELAEGILRELLSNRERRDLLLRQAEPGRDPEGH